MKTKNLTLLFIALFVISCTDQLSNEDVNPQIELTETGSARGIVGGGDVFTTACDPDFEFPTIANGTPGFNSVIVRYDSTLTEEEVHCARYDFFQTYPRLRMGELQSNDIHVDNWQIFNKPMFPEVFPNRLRVGGKVEVETAICVDPRTESEDCED